MAKNKRVKKGRAAKKGQIPVLIMRQQQELTLALREKGAVEAIARGVAEPVHYHTLVDMQGILLIASKLQKTTDSPQYHFVKHVVGQCLANVKTRFEDTDRIGLTGPELEILRIFPVVYRDFWLGKSIELYKRSCDILEFYYHGKITDKEAGLTDELEEYEE